jgi:hypothetical protein
MPTSEIPGGVGVSRPSSPPRDEPRVSAHCMLDGLIGVLLNAASASLGEASTARVDALGC